MSDIKAGKKIEKVKSILLCYHINKPFVLSIKNYTFYWQKKKFLLLLPDTCLTNIKEMQACIATRLWALISFSHCWLVPVLTSGAMPSKFNPACIWPSDSWEQLPYSPAVYRLQIKQVCTSLGVASGLLIFMITFLQKLFSFHCVQNTTYHMSNATLTSGRHLAQPALPTLCSITRESEGT